ncbi:amylo-alpha-1,6-glucosidase [Porifericola rhodea]|uniref:amylo-alpha-1,6-glucosidase n=1 Tax=Porifericola rhodea TaxID=930972 RepID=UPI002665C518|nr:amylo-alpha-1,6-glucosidase [Porifericola rhodea]WKN29888.1 amylo-alpha-1,6-glucosidase [Porifericola rhodea]
MSKEVIRLDDNKYYISADSTYTDDRVHVLNHCDSFAILDRWGDIIPYGKGTQGLYYKDTRYLSHLEFRVNEERPVLLSSFVKEENEILSVDQTNPDLQINGKKLQQGDIHIKRNQFVRNHRFHEKIELLNFSNESVNLTFSLRIHSDFRDIFEVRGLQRDKRGEFLGYQFVDQHKLILNYRGLDQLHRKTQIVFSKPFQRVSTEEGRVFYDVILKPKQQVLLDYTVECVLGEESYSVLDYGEARGKLSPELDKTKAYFPTIYTGNEQFNHWVNRSKADLISLMADTPYGKYPYAGVPWYNTAFGRDGLLTAMQSLWLSPHLSRDVLLYLAATQATEENISSDAEPGKILHETRGGEMVMLNEVPFRRYYGSVDATALFVLLAGMYHKRTGDIATIKQLWPNLLSAMDWIQNYGDIDGDGFVEYQHKAANGLTNQGWKDSYDAVFYATGELAKAPIALCEVQGYVYAAKIHAARLAGLLGKKELTEKWKKEAISLKQKFNQIFWDEEMDCYVLALDGDKKACRVKSSNSGHLLFTGIAEASKARKVAKTLMAPDMFSGWGVRTISSQEVRYNPMSYHNGSVWPHDVALIAWGFARYGMQSEVNQLLRGLFDASLFLNLQRLPELFCGFEKRQGEGPTAYPVACSPQAWSVAAVFMLLQSTLHIDILPENKEVVFDRPSLPEFLPSVNIHKLAVGNSLVDLEIIRHEEDEMVSINWRNAPEGWKLMVVK